MALQKSRGGGLLGGLGGATVSPEEMRRMKRQNVPFNDYYREKYIGEWDYAKDRPARMRAREAEEYLRQQENRLREQFQRDIMRQQPMTAQMQEQIRLDYERRLQMEREKMAMAYHSSTDTNYFTTTSGSANVAVGYVDASGGGKKKKSRGSKKTNWDRPIIGILQDETDDWLEGALEAA